MTKYHSNKPAYIVGIGASAGGLEAIEQFISNVEPDNRLAYIIVQHLSSSYKSLMPDLLSPITDLNVLEAMDGMEICGNTIYLIPHRADLTIGSGLIHLSQRQTSKYPINVFFESLAFEMQENAIGVVLSGTGTDGTESLQKIRDYNGLMLAQDPSTASFSGMPMSAIESGFVNATLPPANMPRFILEHLHKRNHLTNGSEADLTILHEENAVSLIFALLKRRYNLDFEDYKFATMLRRIERRVQLSKSDGVTGYLDVLRQDTEEQDLLYRELLVEVTHFFRDQEAFKFISTEILPDLLKQAKQNRQLRIWVPGCATGEEAYSIAILLHEYMSNNDVQLDTKIFATDVHQRSLDYGSRGLYAADKLTSIPLTYRDRYFTQQHDLFSISPKIRRMVIFAQHNLIQDPPFTRLDFVSCRNVLIYFQPFVQKRVLDHINFGLHKDGILFLGPSENTGDLNNEFAALSHRWRIYKKKYARKYTSTHNHIETKGDIFKLTDSQLSGAGISHLPTNRPLKVSNWEKGLLAKFVPSGLLVDENFSALHIFGDAGKYLSPNEGRVTTSIFSMVGKALYTPLRTALHRATQSHNSVSIGGIKLPDFSEEDDQRHRVDVEPIELPSSDQTYFLISIVPEDTTVGGSSPDHATVVHYNDEEIDHIKSLEHDLEVVKENLQLTIEELETTNEELQTTNEELMASNEELQSTNEELHSVNEELYTVNSEYQFKINELTKLNNDMKNLQRSSRVKILFLDKFMRIRDFTPEMAEVFNLLPHDVGRPIEHLLYNLDISREELTAYANHVLETGKPINREVESSKMARYLLQVLPYQLETGVLEGVVLFMTDISGLKIIEGEMLLNKKRFQALLNNMRRPVIYHDAEGNIIQLNSALAGLLDKEANELIGVNLKSLIINAVDVAPYFEATENNRPTPRITINLHRENETPIQLTFDSQPIFDGIGNLIEYQGIGHIVG